MKHTLQYICGILLAIIVTIVMHADVARASQQERYPVRLYIFHLNTCPHCHEELKFIDSIQSKYPNLEVHQFEASEGMKNQLLFQKVLEHHQLSGGVPTTIIGDEPIVGFDSPNKTGAKIEKRIQECSEKACTSWVDDQMSLPRINEKKTYTFPDTEESSSGDEQKKDGLTFSLFGKDICLSENSSICFIGVALGLADGINPCMFSVLLFLLTYLLAIGSKRRAIRAGIVFVITTFVVYLLFMYGVIRIMDVIPYKDALRWIVIGFALFAGLVMVKDFFFYGKGITLEIPKRFKPTIESLIHKGTLPSAFLLALFSSLVELPCTSGLPLAYVSILAKQQVAPFWYLVLYNLFFIIPLMAIIAGVLLTWTKVEQVESWRERFKKYMRLVAGVLLLLLALGMWLNKL